MRSQRLKFEKGFGLIEILLAVAIFGVAAFAVGHLLSGRSQQKDGSIRASCRDLSNAAMEQIRASSNLSIYDYTNADTTTSGKKSIKFGQNGPTEIFLGGDAGKERWSQGFNPLSKGAAAPIVNTSQLHIGYMGGIEFLYNRNGQSICRGFERFEGLVDAIKQKNYYTKDSNILMRIQPVQLMTNQPLAGDPCPPNLRIRPLGSKAQDASSDYPPHSFGVVQSNSRNNLAFKVTVKVETKDQRGNPSSCESTQIFHHEGQTSLGAVHDATGGGRLGDLACNANPSTLSGTLTFTKSKKGNIFLCRIDGGVQLPAILGERPLGGAQEYCDGIHCRSLQAIFSSAIAKKSTKEPGWFDCRELSNRFSCAGSVSTAYSQDSMKYNIEVRDVAERCQVVVHVAEVDTALNISPVAGTGEMHNPGRIPGNIQCKCDGANGEPGQRNPYWVCGSGKCPEIAAHPKPLAVENFKPGVLTACECFPHSCSCDTFYQNTSPDDNTKGGKCNPNTCLINNANACKDGPDKCPVWYEKTKCELTSAQSVGTINGCLMDNPKRCDIEAGDKDACPNFFQANKCNASECLMKNSKRCDVVSPAHPNGCPSFFQANKCNASECLQKNPNRCDPMSGDFCPDYFNAHKCGMTAECFAKNPNKCECPDYYEQNKCGACLNRNPSPCSCPSYAAANKCQCNPDCHCTNSCPVPEPKEPKEPREAPEGQELVQDPDGNYYPKKAYDDFFRDSHTSNPSPFPDPVPKNPGDVVLPPEPPPTAPDGARP